MSIDRNNLFKRLIAGASPQSLAKSTEEETNKYQYNPFTQRIIDWVSYMRTHEDFEEQ